MPGIIVFRRRWSVGSDDFVVPAVFLVVLHTAWIIVLGVVLGVSLKEVTGECSVRLRDHVMGYLVILSVCVIFEGCIAWVSMRGSILYTEPRASMQYLLYLRLAVLCGELVWLILGIIWIADSYNNCPDESTANTSAKQAIIGIIVCNWIIMFSVLISVWCTFDTAGRSWVKMQRYQQSMRERDRDQQQKDGIKRRKSGSRRRNWRHRKALRAYEESWDRRCRILFCCVRRDRHRNSFTEIAKLFTEFFRELDVVPTDVVAGLVLLRKHQKMRRKCVIAQGSNSVYQFLSGVPITPESKFLRLQEPDELREYQQVVHYMRYAVAAYGWPLYMMMNTGTGLCKIMPKISCCCCFSCRHKGSTPIIIDDNCCHCHYAALKDQSGLTDSDLVYVTYQVDIGETPFFVAIDHEHRTVVISIRGTLSLQDVLTDLKADAEPLPVQPTREDWLGHKGMVQAAEYIKKKLKEEMILSQAFGKDLDRGTQSYELVLVGHSLGAGTAAILAILLHQEFPHLQCYAYSPPGGLLSEVVMEATKSFITSVVVGKDVVPRIGLHQLESLRTDLIDVIKKSFEPKWHIITNGMLCCGKDQEETSIVEIPDWANMARENRSFLHPRDSQIMLTTHTPLYLPGKIIHVVRNHPKNSGKICGAEEPVYQALWTDNRDFDEVLISPTMVNDHMADNVLEALEKVLSQSGPAKPSRTMTEEERKALLSSGTPSSTNEQVPMNRLEASSHSNADELNRSSGQYSLNSDANSLSWDYGSPGAPEKDGETVEHYERQQRAHSYPPAQRPTGLDITGDVSPPMAPLATPETLSEASSVDSVGNRGSRAGFPKVTASVAKMDPIQQSPMRGPRPKSEGYCYYVHPPSPTLNTSCSKSSSEHVSLHSKEAPLQFPPREAPIQYPQITPVSSTFLTEATVEKDVPGAKKAEPHQGAASNLNKISGGPDLSKPNVSSVSAENAGQLVSMHNPETMNETPAGVAKTETSPGSVMQQADKTDINFEEPLLMNLSRHSPDSECNQTEYSNIVGHYSHAGRGYPHGGYQNGFAVAIECEPELEEIPVIGNNCEELSKLQSEFTNPPQVTTDNGPLSHTHLHCHNTGAETQA